MANITKNVLEVKYANQIEQISKANNVDLGVALDMLVQGARNYGTPNMPRYIDNIDVDIIELLKDIREYDAN